MKIDVYNLGREKVGELDLSDDVFGVDVKEHLLYAVVRYQRAAARQGTHKVKQRAEVAGGGKKPWRQKGTGRARQGSTRAPHWRGGGVVHGPHVRSHAFKLNKKVRVAALKSALSRRASEGAVIVLDGLELPEIKTRQVADLLARFEIQNAVVVSGRNENLERSARNLQSVTTLPPEGLNVYDVLRRRTLILTKDAVAAVTERLSGARLAQG